MAAPQKFDTSAAADLDAAEWRIRRLTLTVALIVGMVATGYFASRDIIHRNSLSLAMAGLTIAIFGGILVLNILLHRFLKTIVIGFVALVGLLFLTVLAAQFPHPMVSLWGLTFPLVALLLLGRRRGIAAVVVFTMAVVLVFLLDNRLLGNRYSFEYSVRYSEVLVVIGILSYYFESSRERRQLSLIALNRSLELRVEERTRALEESREQLLQAEKLESIGRLAGGVAHDFNNQLAGIVAFADLIRMASEDGSDIRQYAENILASSRRSADLTGQLLAFARKGNVLTMPVDMHRLVSDIASLLSRTFDKRISILQNLSAQKFLVLGDPSQLHSAILNVAINARDAMPEGGELSLATENAELDQALCASLPHFSIVPGDYLCLKVSDTGIGMDRETKQHIFEPFFTTKEKGKGTGMGLSAVYGTVCSHHGAITVDSEPGKGTTINLYFPVVNAREPFEPRRYEPAQNEKCQGNVLLVDDEQAVAEGSKKLLEALGYTVKVFGGGQEAVDYYAANWSTIDLVILDMIMPVMNGKDTFAAMKEINPGILALLASGYSLNGEAQAILNSGVKGFLQKPFTMEELREKTILVLRNKVGS